MMIRSRVRGAIGPRGLYDASNPGRVRASSVSQGASRRGVAVRRGKGAGLVGRTTASEFGFVGHTSTKLNGTTRNPWDRERTPGGSSGGTAAAVAGGLVPIGTGGDGGGSIRIPSSYCGLFGLKAT